MKKYMYKDGQMTMVEEVVTRPKNNNFGELQAENERLKNELNSKMQEAEVRFGELQAENERLQKQLEKLKSK